MKKSPDNISFSKSWKKCIVISFIFCCYLISAQAETADSSIIIQYVNENVSFQPVAILVNDEIDGSNPGLYFDEDGYVSPELRRYISPQLTGNHEITDIDVSEERIVLSLVRNDQKFIRVAQWDSTFNRYYIIDTDLIPPTSVLDTYHDGNAVLLSIPLMDFDTKEIWEDDWLFLTFQPIANCWYLVDFTDGQSFVATLNDQTYLFDGYYESDPALTWTIQGTVKFEHFSVSSVLTYIQQYYEAKPDCSMAVE